LTDLFEEVEEQLRSDRYRELARKALPWVLGLAAVALVAALGVWGWQQYRLQVTNKASEAYNAALEAQAQGNTAQAAKLLNDAANAGSRAYKSLALMQLGGLKMASGSPADVKQAVAYFDQAAAAAPDDVLGDAARLKSALAILDTASFVEVEGRLEPLLKEGRPYRVQAREASAFARLLKGDEKGARSDFVWIQSALDAPDNARQRAAAAISLIDSGSAKMVAPTVKAELAMPQQVLVAPGGLPIGPGAQPEAAPDAPGAQPQQ
jgi:hypothetical protein